MLTPPSIDLSAVARELNFTLSQVQAVVQLSDEGNTVPFITRYRKEQTGNLDEEQIRAILERVELVRQVTERAGTILRLIETQGKLTPQLRQAIESADSLKRLEDLYLPYRPKKRTRASIARERGLEPLADQIWTGAPQVLERLAAQYINAEKEVATAQDALQGAADIIAEKISEDAPVRDMARKSAWQTAQLAASATTAGEATGQAYRDYFNHSEPVSKLPPHRVLAYNRGEKEGALKIKFDWDDSRSVDDISRLLKLPQHRFRDFLTTALQDALSRLVAPALEREVRRELTDKAQAHAVSVFARNLKNLLLQPPLQGKRVLAVDPGFRTGCKIVVLDENGNRLEQDVVYVTGSADKRAASKTRIAELLKAHDCRTVAIGNGTACRETEEMIAEMIAESVPDAHYVIVNEAGASIYSTSPIAREEFPEDDATARGTISIGRRLQDPLSELVKIDPQHIGVGMYQHDVDEKQLKESLEQVIESCVNYVGVDLNTASASLLRHVSGLNQLTARRVVEYRTQHGPFATRAQLKEVPGIGQATFTQAAGFLKIRQGKEPLDSTWIHPESYAAARLLLKRLDPTSDGKQIPPGLKDRLTGLSIESLAAEMQLGMPTLRDIVDALARPGRDPRGDLPGPLFRQGILTLDDLHPGMELQGTVLNVVDFGAFVDVGLKESGLIHISQLAPHFIRNPHEVVSVGDVLKVWVMSVDAERKRVSLTRLPPGTTHDKSRKPEASAAPRPAASSTTVPPPKGQSSPAAPPKRNVAPHSPPPAGEPMRTFGDLKKLWSDKDG